MVLYDDDSIELSSVVDSEGGARHVMNRIRGICR